MAKTLETMFRRPSLADMQKESGHGPQLKRAIGKWSLMSMGIGCIIGTGIFVLTGEAAVMAGPAVIVAFMMAGFTCLAAGLCYNELALMCPNSGSAYTYARVSMGEYPGWTIGWDLLLEYCVGASAVAAGWSAYSQFIAGNVGPGFYDLLTSNGYWAPLWLQHSTLPAYLHQAPPDMPWGQVGIAASLLMLGALNLRLCGSRPVRWVVGSSSLLLGVAFAFNVAGLLDMLGVIGSSDGWLSPSTLGLGCLAVALVVCSLLPKDSGGAIRWVCSVLALTIGAGYTVSSIMHVTSVDLLAMSIIFVLSVFLSIGARESAWLNNVLVVVKLAVIVMFLLICAPFIAPGHFHPFMPEGWDATMHASIQCFFAFIGFDMISTGAREARNPQKDLPFAITGSLIICGSLYIAVAAVMTGVMYYKDLGGNLMAAPLAKVVDYVIALAQHNVVTNAMAGWVAWLLNTGYGAMMARMLVGIGALAGITSVLLGSLYGQSRIMKTVADDGLVSPFFGKVNSKTHTPLWSIAIWGAAAALMAGLIPLKDLADLVSIGTLFAFLYACAAVIILRRKEPDHKRDYKVPLADKRIEWTVPPGFIHLPFIKIHHPGFQMSIYLGDLVPVVGMALIVYLMFSINFITWMRCIIWLAFGTIIYFNYGRHHSVLNKSTNENART